ncbi:MAG TPA: hypothetical protein VL463_02890 [Kofleriaceae bacterium]|nr:hypothetical protein [Kofleriaceae bacterium]
MSFVRRGVVAIALFGAGAAHAQPMGGDAAANSLEARLAAEEAARKEAEARLAAAEQALAEAQAAAKANADAIAAQKQAIDDLAAQIAAEKARSEAAAAGFVKTATLSPMVGSRWDGVALQGFAEVDYHDRQSSSDQLVDATGAPLNQDRIFVKRARVKLTADYGRVMGAIELDGNTVSGAQVRPMNVEASYSLVDRARGGTSPAVVTAGVFKIPFGEEIGESDPDRLFLERSTSERALFPGEYDAGARLAGTWRSFNYSVAATNGEPIGEKSFPLQDPNGAKDVVGRVGIDAPVGSSRVLAGVSALSGTGFHKGAPATKDSIVWRDLNEDGVVELNEIQNIPGHAATPSSSFSRFAVGADARLVVPVPSLGAFELRGEIYLANNLDRGLVPADPVASAHDLRELGYYAQVLQELSERVQIGVRYDHYDPDADVTDTQSGQIVPSTSTFATLALAAALRFENARLVLEYDVNRNHLGRAADGTPTNLKDNALLVRAEVKF